MEKRKLTKEDLDKVRHIEGFPIGKDEDIIALSDPPYYTACPNPFIADFIKEYGTPYDEATDTYHCEPFAADVSEGKNNPIYMVHSYHTKVPYQAIQKYVAHYTKPGDVIFDGFCGSGMTGIGVELCNQSMDLSHKEGLLRSAILLDLSPIATFISYHYNKATDANGFVNIANTILCSCEKEFGWMFETNHTENEKNVFKEKEVGKINYTIWSDVFICPNCGKDFVFWDVAVDNVQKKVHNSFECPSCGKKLKKTDCDIAQLTEFDSRNHTTRIISKQVPVLINYSYMGKRYDKKPDEADFQRFRKVEQLVPKYWYPTNRMCEGKESRRNDKKGIKYVDQFYYKKNLLALSAFADKAKYSIAFILIHSVSMVNTKLYRFRWYGGGPLTGTLYTPSIVKDINVFKSLREHIDRIAKVKSLLSQVTERCIISTQSSTNLLNIPTNSCDYIFTDPPFGDNLNYSELSFLWESWLNIYTSNCKEVVVNSIQNKTLVEYQQLMTNCLKEFYRILKPNRWMTIEFHNSKNSVWNSIQESLQKAGFIIADIRILDKKQMSFKQVTTSSAVKQDLVISAYKPKDSFRQSMLTQAGSTDTAWSFVAQHLEKLPVVVLKQGRIELVAERQGFLLFDRMVAYHIMNGLPVPLDAADFYRGLDERYLKRDGMYFLPDQVNEYDTARIKNDVEPIEDALWVTNEKSAIAWLYKELSTPQTYAELQPKFMQEVKAIDKHEDLPELSVLLEENFLQGEEGKWYIPDRTKEADIAKLREKKLVKEFEGYLATKGKLKLFRIEAIRAGFAKLWKEKNYQQIVAIAERLPESTVQEDDKLLMYYDISLGRVE